MKKKPYDVYSPEIYPRLLFVSTNTEDITPDMIPHEAVHVADYFCEQLGLYTQGFKDGNEAYAYLVGWAAGNISNTICNELKNKEYDN